MAIINGTPGNDTRTGTPDADTINGLAGNDTLNGLAGNDRITGGEGNDLARMGVGNDTFVWHTGDGDDTLRGQDGFDTLVFEDTNNVFFVIERNASRVRVAETLFGLLGNQLDLDDVERIIVRPLAGADGVFINNLAGTDLKQVVVDLAGVPGGTGGDGEVDGVVRNGGGGTDVMNVALTSGAVSITGPSAAVTIRNADAVDFLQINGLAGNDMINASKLPANVMQMTVNGDDGNDKITGSRGNDELYGGDGNDVVAGGRGNDTVDLGTGNDLFTWSMGDGDDTVQGGDGVDTVRITNSNAGDGFAIVSNELDPSKVEMYKLVGDILVAHLVTAENIERIQVRALAGADVIAIEDLGGGVREVSVDLAASTRGTVADADADTVRLLASGDSDAIAIERAGSNFVVSGFPQKISIAHASNKDTFWIQGQSGSDVIDASALAAGKIKLKLDGGLGDDVFFGSSGNDTATGGDGNDVAYLGAGNDRASGDVGNDRIFLGAGNDVFVWRPGDGRDAVVGQAGFDTLQFNGGAASETLQVNALDGRVHVVHDAFNDVDLNQVERIRIRALDGKDNVFVSDLAGTDIKQVAIDLAGVAGGADGALDNVAVTGSAANELITVTTSAGVLSVIGLKAQVTVAHFDANDLLGINGSDGNDTISAATMKANSVQLSMYGGDGRDVVTGSAGGDTLDGGSGADILRGGGGSDQLQGGQHNDRLEGGAGKDILIGSSGDDKLLGGLGDDSLLGDQGNDTITGGAGNDRIFYGSVLDGHDVILDFDGNPTGGQDTLNLEGLFQSLPVAPADRAGRVSIVDHGATVDVFVDADGKAGNGFELAVATLHTINTITVGQDVIVGT